MVEIWTRVSLSKTSPIVPAICSMHYLSTNAHNNDRWRLSFDWWVLKMLSEDWLWHITRSILLPTSEEHVDAQHLYMFRSRIKYQWTLNSFEHLWFCQLATNWTHQLFPHWICVCLLDKYMTECRNCDTPFSRHGWGLFDLLHSK